MDNVDHMRANTSDLMQRSILLDGPTSHGGGKGDEVVADAN